MNTTDVSASATAAQRLFDAEFALHIARQTGVDEWIRAAADGLHVAVEVHRRALSSCGAARGG